MVFLAALTAISSHAQDSLAWDDGGNGQLSGSYHFREVVYVTGDVSGTLSRAISLSGTIEFDGNGMYALSGSLVDSDAPPVAPQAYTTTGAYVVSAAGHGFLSSPVSGGDFVYGLVANGVFVGSSTESGFNDLFVAVPAASPETNVETFQGSYRIVHIDFPEFDAALARNSLFALQSDGAGAATSRMDAAGYVAGSGETVVGQNLGVVQYSFSNGVGTLSFPAGQLTPQTLIVGEKTFYISPDGNFIFGGSTGGWDLFLGVRSGPVAPNAFDGRYFQAGIHHDASELSNGLSVLDTYYGALSAADGAIIGHQRVRLGASEQAYDYTYGAEYDLDAEGAYDGPSQIDHYVLGAGGFARLSFSRGPFLGIGVALKTAEIEGAGVFLHPAGVVNAGSFAPFTNGIAPGEIITLFGANLASTTEPAAATPLPASLAGVEVRINNRSAPVLSVSPGQVSAIVPFDTQGPIARIHTVNNGVASNIATAFVNRTAPGVFTVSSDGLSDAVAQHADFSLVDSFNPAQPGETVLLYVAGLGDVNPGVADGSAAPSSPVSQVLHQLTVLIDGQTAAISYAGLAPGFAGLYQINVDVPAGTRRGDVPLEVAGPDSSTSQATLAVGPASAALGSETRARTRTRRFAPSGLRVLSAPRFKWDQH